MSLKEAVSSAFKNYANFKGRARRSEYWYFSLFNFLVTIAVFVISAIISAITQDFTSFGIAFPLLGVYSVATLLPNLSVTCRRLHDVGKSGAFIFFFLLPIVGEILVWVWSFQDGQAWTNQYGVDPKGRNMVPFGAVYYDGYNAAAIGAAGREKPETNSPKKKCSSCGSEIDVSSVFCPVCGNDTRDRKTKLEKDEAYNHSTTKADVLCVNCGRTIEDGIAFCPYCGENTKKVKYERGSTFGEIRPKVKGFSVPTDLD